MQFSIKHVAAAVSLALVSAAANAQLATPAIGAADPMTSSATGAQTGLFLEVWNTTGSNATELVNLSYAYADIGQDGVLTDAGATANNNLNTASGPAWTLATNPSTGSGQVQQLNFGTIANAATFATGSKYVIASAAGPLDQNIGTGALAITSTSALTPSKVTYSGLQTVLGNVQGELGAWNAVSTAGTFFDATGGTGVAGNKTTLTGGTSFGLNFNNGNITAASVGSAVSFYNVIGNAAGSQDNVNTYAGFWNLSTAGVLTYNIASATSAVPLPAGAWLLGSGLLGMFGVGRRRRALTVA